MTLTNRSLLVAVTLTLIVSAVGTFLSVSSIASLFQVFPSTGYATSGVGNVTIVIAKEISITTADSEIIDFGGCRPGDVIYSDVADANADGDCPGFSPTAIIVRNTGAYPVNITINATDWGEAHGGSFLNASTDDSWLAFKVTNASAHPTYNGGCTGFNSSWRNITGGAMYQACDMLQTHAFNNSMSIDIAIFIPNGTQAGDTSVDFVIWAYQI